METPPGTCPLWLEDKAGYTDPAAKYACSTRYFTLPVKCLMGVGIVKKPCSCVTTSPTCDFSDIDYGELR
jgi:hypothetical protein